jgi:hypothetical protein
MTGAAKFFFQWVFLGVILRLLHLKQYERFLTDKKARFFIHPGWHQLLPDGWFFLVDAGLVFSILFNLINPSKKSMALVTLFIFADYFTFPGRMMNHYTLLLFVLGIYWVWFLFDKEPIGDNTRVRKSLFGLLGMGFFCAAIHKLNHGYLDVETTSNVCVKIFQKLGWIFGVNMSPPRWVLRSMAIFSIGFELLVLPLALLGFNKFPKAIAISCLVFIFALVLLKSVPDYTWIASCFMPLLFTDCQWVRINRNMKNIRSPLFILLIGFLILEVGFVGYLGVKVLLFFPVGILCGSLIYGICTESRAVHIKRKSERAYASL